MKRRSGVKARTAATSISRSWIAACPTDKLSALLLGGGHTRLTNYRAANRDGEQAAARTQSADRPTPHLKNELTQQRSNAEELPLLSTTSTRARSR